MRLPPGVPLFPYTTLFRSVGECPDGVWLPAANLHRIVRRYDPCAGGLAIGVSPPHAARRWLVVVHVSAVPEFALFRRRDRKSTRLNSSHGYTSYAVFCLKQ